MRRRLSSNAVDVSDPLLKVLLGFRDDGLLLLPIGALTILAYLGQQPEERTGTAAIRQLLKVSPQRASYLCRLLARHGLVRRTPSTEDGRVVLNQITAKGLRRIGR